MAIGVEFFNDAGDRVISDQFDLLVETNREVVPHGLKTGDTYQSTELKGGATSTYTVQTSQDNRTAYQYPLFDPADTSNVGKLLFLECQPGDQFEIGTLEKNGGFLGGPPGFWTTRGPNLTVVTAELASDQPAPSGYGLAIYDGSTGKVRWSTDLTTLQFAGQTRFTSSEMGQSVATKTIPAGSDAFAVSFWPGAQAANFSKGVWKRTNATTLEWTRFSGMSAPFIYREHIWIEL
ncbi:MAG: hypothetical protein AAGL89_12255 [Pseudomonadota bacterium]